MARKYRLDKEGGACYILKNTFKPVPRNRQGKEDMEFTTIGNNLKPAA
jgi:hypothetical protein